MRRGAIVDHVMLAQMAHVLDRHYRFVQLQPLAYAIVIRGLRNEGERSLEAAAVSAEHHAVMHRLRRRDRGVRIAHLRCGDHAALQNGGGLDAEEGRFPQDQVGDLADFNRADYMRDAVGNRWIDGVLGDVALDPEIVRFTTAVFG